MILQGKFKPTHPEKYKGNPAHIVYRSSWELRMMGFLDLQEDILEWSSEELAIPYISAVDGIRHTYFPDFFIKYRNVEGKTKCMVVEIKPAAQTQPPVPNTFPEKTKRVKQTKKFLREAVTYAVNCSKWAYAERYCKDRNWEFRLMTENDLYGRPFTKELQKC